MILQQKYPSFYDEEGIYIIGSKENKIERLKDELRSTDYLCDKFVEGCDMTKYGDWKTPRQALRNEINMLEQLSI